MTSPEEQQGPTVRHPDEVGTDVHVEPKKVEKEEKEEAAPAKAAPAKATSTKSDK